MKELTPLAFRSDELPTDSAYATLIREVAAVEGQDASTVRLNYFKTSEADSIALKGWIERIHKASKARRAPAYDVTRQNCATFTICGLVAGNAIRPDAKISLVPNWLFELLSVPSAENYSHGERSRPKERVPDAESTFKPCGPGNPYCPGNKD